MSKLGELKEILKKLIAIPSVTGNEHDIAIYIADYLRQCGVDSVELQPVEGKRLNVVAHLKGEKVGPVVLLTGHMDTVAPGEGWRTDPFKATERDGRIYGRGAADMKGGIDALSSESIKRLVDKTKQKFGSVDIVVNSVGGGEQPRGFETLSDDDWDRIIRLNLYSMFYMCRAAFPYMKEQLSGKIVNISSGFALAGGDYCAHYATAKAGAIGFTTSLAKEMAPYNVNVNVIPVPTTDTPLLRATLSQEMIQREIDVTPMKRIATTEDIADTVLFLVSDAARYITGQIIAPNGGRRMLV